MSLSSSPHTSLSPGASFEQNKTQSSSFSTLSINRSSFPVFCRSKNEKMLQIKKSKKNKRELISCQVSRRMVYRKLNQLLTEMVWSCFNSCSYYRGVLGEGQIKKSFIDFMYPLSYSKCNIKDMKILQALFELDQQEESNYYVLIITISVTLGHSNLMNLQ